MDAKAMEDHDWDDCGELIADLFQADRFKTMGIRHAWWATDEDDQVEIHEVLCEHRRDPAALEKAQAFEKLAQSYEEKFRKQEAEEKARRDQAKVAEDAKLMNTTVEQARAEVHARLKEQLAQMRNKTENAW